MKRATVFALLSLSGVFACQKDEEKPLSTTELLLARAWRITAATTRVNGRTATDVFRSRPDCVKDNAYRFENDNQAGVDEGILKCATADAQKTAGRWNLADSTLSVTATNATATRNYGFTGVIRALNATTLVLVNTQQADTTTTVTRTTFTAQ